MAWSDVSERISFPFLPFNWNTPGDGPRFQQTVQNPDEILEALRLIYEGVDGTGGSAAARELLDRLVNEDKTVEIRQNDGYGCWTKTYNLFGEIVFSNQIVIDVPQAKHFEYLGLNGEMSTTSPDQYQTNIRLGTVVLHEIMHTFGYFDDRIGGSQIRQDAAYLNPSFNYISESDRLVNVVRAELGLAERGAYRSISPDIISYIDNLGNITQGSFDQATVFLNSQHASGTYQSFTSIKLYFDSRPSDDLVIAYNLMNDVSTGAGNDVIVGGGNEDKLFGGDGTDRLYGQSGNDLVNGGGGNDLVFGGDGNDILLGGGGLNSLYGGSGDDIGRITLASDTQFFYGDLDSDTAVLDFSSYTGSIGYDASTAGGFFEYRLHGVNELENIFFYLSDVDHLEIICGSGNDRLSGSISVADTLRGNGGKDSLFGTIGDDFLFGGIGADLLSGDDETGRHSSKRDHDILTGGAAGDRFVFLRGFGHDEITDFSGVGKFGDHIDLTAWGISAAKLAITSASGGQSTLVTIIATGDSILLGAVVFGSLVVGSDILF